MGLEVEIATRGFPFLLLLVVSRFWVLIFSVKWAADQGMGGVDGYCFCPLMPFLQRGYSNCALYYLLSSETLYLNPDFSFLYYFPSCLCGQWKAGERGLC